MDIPLHSNQIDSWKNFFEQRVLKRHQLAVFRSAPVIFQAVKNALVVIEYLLVFFVFMEYIGAKLEKVDQNIPLRSWTLNLRSCN